MSDIARWVLDHPEAAITMVGALAALFKKSRNWLFTLLAAPFRLVSWLLTSFATPSKTPTEPDRLPLNMPIWLKVRLDRLLDCNSADEVANLFRQEGIRGRKDMSHMCPTAVFIRKDGRCSVNVSTDGISIWEHGGIGAWRIRAPHVVAFEEAFHRGEHEEVHMFPRDAMLAQPRKTTQ